MKILLFHGYLLRGTGSNVYNAQLAQAFARLGHTVHVLAQERRPEALGWVDGERITVHRPDIGELLPVYVADRYEGFAAKPFLDCTDAEIEEYVARNVAAVREVAEEVGPDVALANHLVMGPAILARALGPLGVPYAVKIHGSALEYVVKRDPERFLPWAREGLAGARGVLVGSRHTAESLWEAMGDPGLPERTRLGPPGVDVAEFAPRAPAAAAQGVGNLIAHLHELEEEAAPEGSMFARDVRAAATALERLRPGDDRLVAFVGKLIVSKGVDLLAAAWPLVLQRVPQARLVVVGFGAYREGFERLLGALAAGDLAAARELADAGREVEGGPRAPLRHLRAFLGTVDDDYLRAAASLPDRVVVVGRLEHAELADLLPACDAQVVPSTFPEAFGMVAAEAAACGVLPVSAGHSGLAEVSAQLAGTLPEAARPWLSFSLEGDPVRELADRVAAWLEAPGDVRSAAREALVATARERFSWEGVARGVIDAAEGRLQRLGRPTGPLDRVPPCV
jgi:glycosyltransferase involved in cell wall biosynthesis